LEAQGSGRAIRTHSGAAIGSSIGLVRKSNEDCCLVARASYAHGSRANFTIAMVCDGLGGMRRGREAAILAASAFTAHLFSAPAIACKERLSQAIAYANAGLSAAAR
jgi:serine/threonine protein phosphatase PrpC